MKKIDSLIDNDLYSFMYQLSTWKNEIMAREIKDERLLELNNTEWMQELKSLGYEPEAIHISGASAEGKMVVQVYCK